MRKCRLSNSLVPSYRLISRCRQILLLLSIFCVTSLDSMVESNHATGGVFFFLEDYVSTIQLHIDKSRCHSVQSTDGFLLRPEGLSKKRAVCKGMGFDVNILQLTGG